MIIVRVGVSEGNSIPVDVELETDDMVVDPRAIGGSNQYSCSVKGRILTVTRIDGDGGGRSFKMRAYMPTEDIPDFTSTVYIYLGVDGECAPRDVTEAFLHSSVTIIQRRAFILCKSLVRITIPDTVTTIEQSAFMKCHSLRFIRFSRNLVSMGDRAFSDCTSLVAVFLPPTVRRIGSWAFYDCPSLRFLNLFAIESINHIRYTYNVFDGWVG